MCGINRVYFSHTCVKNNLTFCSLCNLDEDPLFLSSCFCYLFGFPPFYQYMSIPAHTTDVVSECWSGLWVAESFGCSGELPTLSLLQPYFWLIHTSKSRVAAMFLRGNSKSSLMYLRPLPPRKIFLFSFSANFRHFYIDLWRSENAPVFTTHISLMLPCN